MEQTFKTSRRAQLTLFDVFLGVIQPAAFILMGAAVVKLDSMLYLTLLLIAVLLLMVVQYANALRNQPDRTRELFADYLQNRSNLLSVLTALATYSRDTGNLTKVGILGAIESWFEEDLLHDYYWDQEIESIESKGMKFRRKPFWRRLLSGPKSELRGQWWSIKARLRNQPNLELIDIVFHAPNEDTASMVIARGLEEGFIEETLVPEEHPSSARIEYDWTASVLIQPAGQN